MSTARFCAICLNDRLGHTAADHAYVAAGSAVTASRGRQMTRRAATMTVTCSACTNGTQISMGRIVTCRYCNGIRSVQVSA